MTTVAPVDTADFDDLFDAEIIVDRRFGNAEFTARDLGMLLGSPTANGGRQRVCRMLAAGEIPKAAHPGGQVDPDRWTKAQVIRIVAARLPGCQS